MTVALKALGSTVQGTLLRKGTRVFALLGKATPFGLESFGPNDVHRAWALTAEFGCLRLESLSGDEEVTGERLVLTTPFSYDYGIVGATATADLIRAVFGLLPAELDQLVSTMRRGGFPVLGFSRGELICAISGCLIPGHWPHVVVSNTAVCGNVVSLETFLRLVVSSLPQGQLLGRFPGLQSTFKQISRSMLQYRQGLSYSREALPLAPCGLSTATR
jgi:hypothetical protein